MLIRLVTTFECKNNCEYCFVKTNGNYKPEKPQIDKIKEQLDKLNAGAYELIGGEPFHDLEMLEWFFKYNAMHQKARITFFTSATYNVDEVIQLSRKYISDFHIEFAVSYDGKNSKRNRNNFELVKGNIEKLKKEFKTTIRWSVNREDIPSVFETFIELFLLGINIPIFFPMKYSDYTEDEIKEFCLQFQKMLDYSIDNNFNFMGINILDCIHAYPQKENFYCNDELTVLPDGQICNCYVLYSSSGYDKKYIKDKPEQTHQIHFQAPELCDKCVYTFQSCNKCFGNLLEYQRKTGKKFFYTYCDLMQRLSEIFIKTKINKVNPSQKFYIIKGQSALYVIEKINDEICVMKKERTLC